MAGAYFGELSAMETYDSVRHWPDADLEAWARHTASQAEPLSPEDAREVVDIAQALLEGAETIRALAPHSPIDAVQAIMECTAEVKACAESAARRLRKVYKGPIVPAPHRQAAPLDEHDRTWLKAYWLRYAHGWALSRISTFVDALEPPPERKVTRRLSGIKSQLERFSLRIWQEFSSEECRTMPVFEPTWRRENYPFHATTFALIPLAHQLALEARGIRIDADMSG